MVVAAGRRVELAGRERRQVLAGDGGRGRLAGPTPLPEQVQRPVLPFVVV
jgi:hypothetical protein